MIPVVDSNWHPEMMVSDSTVVHVLKGVYIQQKMTAYAAADDLQKAREFALTPGSGGFPQGIVAWCDLSYQSIDSLTNTSHVSGLSVSIDTTNALNPCLDALKSKNQSLDLDLSAMDAQRIAQAISAYSDVPVVLDVSKFGSWDKTLLLTQCQHVLEPFRRLDNVNIKISGIGPIAGFDSDSEASHLFKDIVDTWGPDRVLLASQSPASSDSISFDTLWMRYEQDTRHLRARERESVLRSNAIRVYRL